MLATDALCSSADETHDAMMTIYRSRFCEQVETADTEVSPTGQKKERFKREAFVHAPSTICSAIAFRVGEMTPSLETIAGAAAAICTTASYMPQLRKCWTTGETDDLSSKMLLLLACGLSLWVAYGLMRADWVVGGANKPHFKLMSKDRFHLADKELERYAPRAPTTTKNKGDPMETFEQLFEETLRDIYYAEKTILKALPKMAKKASSKDLSAAFNEHLSQTEGQVARLEQIFKMIGKSARGKKCEAIEGLTAEADEIIGLLP